MKRIHNCCTSVPVYMAETSPEDIRGFLGASFQVMITFGQVTSALVDALFVNNSGIYKNICYSNISGAKTFIFNFNRCCCTVPSRRMAVRLRPGGGARAHPPHRLHLLSRVAPVAGPAGESSRALVRCFVFLN